MRLRLPYLFDEQQARHGVVVPVLARQLRGQPSLPVTQEEITPPALENNPQSGARTIGRNVMKSGRMIHWIDKIDGGVLIDQPLKFRSITLPRSLDKF